MSRGSEVGYGASTVTDYLAELAAARPAPAAGTATGFVVASAAALTAMAGRAASRLDGAASLVDRADQLRVRAAELADIDAGAYGEVVAARRAAKERGSEPAGDPGVQRAMAVATDVPLELAGVAGEIVELAAILVRDGAPPLRADASAAVHLAAGAVAGLGVLVRANTSAADLPPDRGRRVARVEAEVREVVASLARGSG